MSGSERPYLRQQATRVFTNKQAIVIGPTPPGTGVIAPATLEQLENSASPTSRLLPLLPSTLLIPTSISVAPGLIQLPLTISALPTAATTISARPTTCSKFLVLECVMVTVQLSFNKSCAIGLPTMLERPTITASIPDKDP